VDDLAQLLQTHLGQAYHIEHELGGGGMSRLFVAHDNALGRSVVIKVLPRTLALAVSAERFRREIMVVAALQHPQIVPVLRAGELDGLPYFIMPFIEGKSLRSRIARGPLSVRETVAIMRDVARALEYAHRHGVIHRDIKPDNVLLSADSAVVTDFGVAKAISVAKAGDDGSANRGAATGVGVSMGTPAYMAPEQAAADPDVDQRVDLYALGILGYEMLVGTPPFSGRPAQALLAAHLTETPPSIRSRRYDVPPALGALIASCLDKDPAKRPSSATKVLWALDDPDITSGTFTSPTDVKHKKRHWPRVGAYAASIVAAVALGWAIARAGRAPSAAADPAARQLAIPAADSLRDSSRRGTSIALLPLLTADGDRTAAAFGEGVLSQLYSALSAVPGVRVASRTATNAVSANANATPAAVGRALNTALLLEGSAQQNRGRVRLTVRLVDVAADSTMWSEMYERSASDLFAAEDDVAKAIVTGLRPRMMAAEGDSTSR